MQTKIENFKIAKKTSKFMGIITDINKQFGTDFTEDVEPLLQITLNNMKKGKSFEDSFKAAMESILNLYERIDNIDSTKKIAVDYMFKELYRVHGD